MDKIILVDFYISSNALRLNSVHSLHQLRKSSIFLNFTARSVDGFRANEQFDGRAGLGRCLGPSATNGFFSSFRHDSPIS